MSAGTLVIDVRDPEDYVKAHIPGALNIRIGTLADKVAAAIPARDTPLVCYCNGGSRGPRAAAELRMMGYTNVSSLAGGLRAWASLRPEQQQQ